MKNTEIIGGRQLAARNRNLARLMTPAEVAELLGVQVQTLTAWRCRGAQELPYVKAGRLVRYREADVERFVQMRTVGAVDTTGQQEG